MTRAQLDVSLRALLSLPEDLRDQRQFGDLAKALTATACRWLIEHKRGPGLTNEDIEEVVASGIHELWRTYSPERSHSPTAFFNKIVVNGALDYLRAFRARKLAQIGGPIALTPGTEVRVK